MGQWLRRHPPDPHHRGTAATTDCRNPMSPSAEASEPAASRTGVVILTLSLAGMLAALQQTLVVPMLPEVPGIFRSEEHTSELQSLMRISYAVFCLQKKKTKSGTVNHNIA